MSFTINGVCPHCGYCPHCGRRGGWVSPWSPSPYWGPWYGTNAMGGVQIGVTGTCGCQHGEAK